MNMATAGRRRALLLFGAVVGVYLAAYLLTMKTAHHPVRPLYEGVGPAPAYRWVRAPKAFSATNNPPPSHVQPVLIGLGPQGSVQAGVVSSDSQAVLNFPAGAVAPAPGQIAVAVDIKALDPARLGLLPPGLFADGNAYQVLFSYQPSKQPITTLARPANVVVTTPAPAAVLLYSLDGQAWQRLDTTHIPASTSVAASWQQSGYFLGAATVNVLGTAGTSGKGRSTIVIAALAAVLVLVLIVAPLLWRQRRKRQHPS
jgi:hypothetical protein